MQGSAKRNIMMFKKLCGDDALENVILATTMWDTIESELGAAREKQLIDTKEFWGYMAAKGSRVYRHENTHESAMRLIGHFVKADTKVTLEIQQEMVDQHKMLDGTAAAATVEVKLTQERARFDKELRTVEAELQEALRKRDAESTELLRELRSEHRSELKKIKSAQQSLRVSMEQLHKERYAFLEKELAKQREAYENLVASQKQTARPPVEKTSSKRVSSKGNLLRSPIKIQASGERAADDLSEPRIWSGTGPKTWWAGRAMPTFRQTYCFVQFLEFVSERYRFNENKHVTLNSWNYTTALWWFLGNPDCRLKEFINSFSDAVSKDIATGDKLTPQDIHWVHDYFICKAPLTVLLDTSELNKDIELRSLEAISKLLLLIKDCRIDLVQSLILVATYHAIHDAGDKKVNWSKVKNLVKNQYPKTIRDWWKQNVLTVRPRLIERILGVPVSVRIKDASDR